jgi:orotate phosphoribosyltransferase
MKKTVSILGSSTVPGDSIEHLEGEIRQLLTRFHQDGITVLVGTGGGISSLCITQAKKLGIPIGGISPCSNAEEHLELFSEDPNLYEPIIFTGFGFKGRNVILVRSANAVVAIEGSMGTLNELTIAWDEGKIIGIVESAKNTAASKFPELADTLKKKNIHARLVSCDSAKKVAHEVISALKQSSPKSLKLYSVEELFDKADAIKRGHFEIKSGHHTTEFWEKALVFQYPQILNELAERLADKIKVLKPDVIVGPPVGGAILSYAVAKKLGCKSIFFDKDSNDDLSLVRGYSLDRRERIVIVDDIVSSGKTIKNMEDVLLQHGLLYLGSFVIVNRIQGTNIEDRSKLHLPIVALLDKSEPKNIDANKCEYCKVGEPVKLSKLQAFTVVG